MLGSKSGFDSIADCYADLAGEVFAIETGLSSDPPMNWMCSALDAYRLMSNSDAHSPPMLGREATTFGTCLDYFAMAGALRTGDGLIGTIEFYPEEGKYHLDGHRKCGVRLAPGQTRSRGGNCPECGKQVTVGVLHRVAELADRPAGYRPPGAARFTNLVQLPQVVGEILATGAKSKKASAEVSRLVAVFGPELGILGDIPLSDLGRAGGGLLAEAIARLRRGEVRRAAGYDGEYGTVRLFDPGELDQPAALFEAPRPAAVPPPRPGQQPAAAGRPAGQRLPGSRTPAAGLDPDQRAAMLADGPLLIIAGPGTGKTRTLTYRIAHQITGRGAAPESCLAITFTRRAARELRERLAALAPPRAAAARQAGQAAVTTFHGLGLMILRDHHEQAGLAGDFQVADDAARLGVAAELAGSARGGRRLLAAAGADPAQRELLVRELLARNLVDFDGLIELPVALLRGDPALTGRLRGRWPLISVDEYQDIDAAQYDLLRLLAGDGRGLTAIGDPDQAIYGFRGADVGFFLRFSTDFAATTTRQLTRSYRASRAIVTAALQAIAPATLVPDRRLEAAAARGAPVLFHQAADEHAEAAWIAAAIDRLLGGSSFHSLDSGRSDGSGQDGIDLSEVAVLYRTDAQAGPLGRALARAGLPFQKISHDLLERRAGVAEIVREMRRAAAAGGGDPVASVLRAAVRRLAVAGPGGGPGPGPGRSRAIDIRSAGQVLLPLACRCGGDLDLFLTEIALGAVADAPDPRARAVTLATLHAAKGLEFGAVFVAGCEQGLLPLWIPGPAAAAGADLAEERRLLFVGMTRARDRLFLSCAARRTRHGGRAAAGPSPFLAAIDPELLDRPSPPRRSRPAGQQLRLL